MTHRALLKEAVQSLRAARQRTILALLGITVGIGSVIAMVSIGSSAQNEAEAQFRDLGTDLFTVSLGYDLPSGRAGAGLAALTAVPRATGAVSAVAPVSMPGSVALYRGAEIDGSEMLGITDALWRVLRTEVVDGRRLASLDDGRRFCVVGSDVARQLEAAGVARVVGERVQLGDRLYTVVGVLGPAARSRLMPFAIDSAILVPIGIAMRAAGREPTFAIGRLRATDDFRAVVANIESRLSDLGYTPMVETTEELIEQMERQTRLFTLLLGAIGVISLVVGGVGVMNVMLSSLAERRKEIGLRRALGAQRVDVQRQFLIESLMLGIAGGAFGVALGIGAAAAVCNHTGWTLQVSQTGVCLGVTMSAAVGCFFGYYPARQAARIHPMLVLRAG